MKFKMVEQDFLGLMRCGFNCIVGYGKFVEVYLIFFIFFIDIDGGAGLRKISVSTNFTMKVLRVCVATMKVRNVIEFLCNP